MSYIMYICPGCRNYFKTGSSGKKIKCPKCKEEYLTDLKIADEEWRKLDADARKTRINRAIAGEHLREAIPAPEPVPVKAPEVTPSVPAEDANPQVKEEDSSAKSKEDLPDEVILEAKKILEEQDMHADMPRQPVDRRRLAVVCGVSSGLVLLLTFLSLILPVFRLKEEGPALLTAQVGDTVSFGKYKGNTGWTVLEKDDDSILAVSDFYVANAVPEDKRDKDRQIEWLNSSFINRTFNIYERKRLQPLDDEDGDLVHIMDESLWASYSQEVGLENDGKVHPICRIGIMSD